jgi:hypothetical protein
VLDPHVEHVLSRTGAGVPAVGRDAVCAALTDRYKRWTSGERGGTDVSRMVAYTRRRQSAELATLLDELSRQ